MRYPAEATYCFIEGATLVDALVSTVLDERYHVGESIVINRTNAIYRATRVADGRTCAIKLAHRAAGSALRERFESCAEASRKIGSPHVVEIIDHGIVGDDLYLVMELLTGTSLSARMAEGVLPIEPARELMIQLARGVARAHDVGEVHGALQPACVFVARDGERDVVKIFDFGAARVGREGRKHAREIDGIMEALPYVAPERGKGGDGGQKADLYALGAIFYRMVTGRPPFDPTIDGFRDKAPAHAKLLRPLVPDALDALILSLLANAPSERPADAHAVEAALAAIAR
jgi:serine/threonine-protein kinase